MNSALTFCHEGKQDCRANYHNMCVALDDTEFSKPCPFYKTHKQWIAELIRLQDRGHCIKHLIQSDEEEI